MRDSQNRCTGLKERWEPAMVEERNIAYAQLRVTKLSGETESQTMKKYFLAEWRIICVRIPGYSHLLI